MANSSKYQLPITNSVMRYSIMLQLVTGITLVLVGAAALFAWIQNRPNPTPETRKIGLISNLIC
ncbi:hypothetical protein [Microseira sp. BLCC-F43]|jgi:hypothetical protein|uniref:hypothetical protein n=1 Tax=Microseira sp. BLCC-F43 TaxID=3153602 RepID=UPI0035BB8C28